MQYTIENEFIRLTVDSLGAEMVSAVDRATGSEMIWCADPAVWNRHAPILFPYAGKLTGGHFKAADGKLYEGKQHGFFGCEAAIALARTFLPTKMMFWVGFERSTFGIESICI